MHTLLKAASGVRCVQWAGVARREYWCNVGALTRRSRALHSLRLSCNEWYVFYLYLLVHCSAPRARRCNQTSRMPPCLSNRARPGLALALQENVQQTSSLSSSLPGGAPARIPADHRGWTERSSTARTSDVRERTRAPAPSPVVRSRLGWDAWCCRGRPDSCCRELFLVIF